MKVKIFTFSHCFFFQISYLYLLKMTGKLSSWLKNFIIHYIKVVNNFFKRFNVVKSSTYEKYLILKKLARKTTLCQSSVKCAQAHAFVSHI